MSLVTERKPKSVKRKNISTARYIGYVGYGNLGDEALFEAIARLFADRIAFDASKELGLINSLLTFYQSVFLGGGTLIKAPSMQYKRVKNALRMSPLAKFIVFGTGVGDPEMWSKFGHATNKKAWCNLLEKTDYLAVRGPLSQQYLQDCGVKKDIKVIGDPALLFAREGIAPKNKSKRIGLNFFSTGTQRWIHGQNEANVLEFAESLLRYLNDEGWNITLFPMTKKDESYLTQLLKTSNVEASIFTDYHDTAATLDRLEEQDVFVGERLHSTILASCVYTPAISIEYRTKCRDFMLSINRGAYNSRTDNLNLDRTIEQIDELYSNIPRHQQDIFTNVRARQKMIRDAALEVIRISHK